MYSILLAIIYIAFVSLGIPDAVLGSAWPVMHSTLEVPLSYAGIVTMIICIGTIISSFYSDKVVAKLGTGKVSAISTAMTALALIGFSFSNSFLTLCLIAIPYGLGAGSIDAALNNFVAVHYKAKHMNWLHCCWGIGATCGPFIMGQVLLKGFSWRNGYFIIGLIQTILTIVLFASLPIWKKFKEQKTQKEETQITSKKEVLKINGVKEVLISFFCYCALETTTGLWAASYMVVSKEFNVEKAATFAAMFYLGITFGRFICGFISIKMQDKNLIRLGQILMLIGISLLILPFNTSVVPIGLIIIGIGCAPVYPALIHSTPTNFGEKVSQSVIGMQMASAYVGSSFIPPIFGFLQKYISMNFYPAFLLIFIIAMILLTEKMNFLLKHNKATLSN